MLDWGVGPGMLRNDRVTDWCEVDDRRDGGAWLGWWFCWFIDLGGLVAWYIWSLHIAYVCGLDMCVDSLHTDCAVDEIVIEWVASYVD